MNFIRFKNQLQDLPVFTINDIRKIEPSFQPDRLTDWLEKGYIKRIIRNNYVFSDLKLSEETLFFIANKIYEPSYISMESALSFYKLIPDQVFAITCLSTRKTTKFETGIGTFLYRSIKPEIFFGYRLVKFNNMVFKIAEIEKVILDYFYLRSELKDDSYFYELRINDEEFKERVDINKLKSYLELFRNKSLERRINKFLKFIYD